MFGRNYSSKKAQVAMTAPAETLPVPAPNFLPVSLLSDPGLLEIMAKDNSLARKVYETSADKEHPDYQPILRFLRQEGYKRLESVSRLPALQEQRRFEEIADLILQGPDARYLKPGFGHNLSFVTLQEVWKPAAMASEDEIFMAGLIEVGITDKTYVRLFQDLDIIRIIDYMKEHNPGVFSKIPSGEAESRREQLHYVEDWGKTLTELGKSALRAQCRKAGVIDTNIGEYKANMLIGNIKWPTTREAIMYQLRKGGAINKAIQTIEYFVRDGKDEKGDVFAFVELAEPKGLDIVCEINLCTASVLSDILSEGKYNPKHPTNLAKELVAVQEYEENSCARITKLGQILVRGAAVAGVVGALATGHTLGSAAFAGCGTTMLSALGFVAYTTYLGPRASESLNQVCKSLPFPGLSDQARRNYLQMYKLEGLTRSYMSPQEKAARAAYAKEPDPE